MKNWNITSIENITYEEAQNIALETMKIKDHDCFFIDFVGAFGYSVLVFKNAMHIHYANDYELHHDYRVKEQGKEALREYYIKEMNKKLYTDAELLEDAKSYDEYKKKNYFLRNYWIMRYEHLSIFGIGEEAKKEFDNVKPNFPYYNPISFCYVADKNIVDNSIRISKHLENSYKALQENREEFRKMIAYELANHEACITCDYTDTLQDLGMRFEDLTVEKQNIVKEELGKQIQNYC